jgi:hypothetical protein
LTGNKESTSDPIEDIAICLSKELKMDYPSLLYHLSSGLMFASASVSRCEQSPLLRYGLIRLPFSPPKHSPLAKLLRIGLFGQDAFLDRQIIVVKNVASSRNREVSACFSHGREHRPTNPAGFNAVGASVALML